MTDFALARKNMVDCQIHTAGVVTPAILDAFRTVPREKFVPAPLTGVAYQDDDIALGKGRFLLAPACLARMMEAAEITPSDRVLDIGSGTGYAAVIMAAVAAHVTALDDKDYAEKITANAKALGIKNVTAMTGALNTGHADGAPYDLIFINGAVGALPDKLGAQLKEGGRMIAIFRDKNTVMGQVVITRKGHDGALSSRPLFEAGAAYLPGFEPRTTFSFGL